MVNTHQHIPDITSEKSIFILGKNIPTFASMIYISYTIGSTYIINV